MMLGIMCALPSEARHLVAKCEAKLCYEKHGIRLYKCSHYVIGVSGVGTLNAALAVQTMVTEFPELRGIVNIGLCGSPNKQKHSIGDIFAIEAIHSSEMLRPIYPDIIFSHHFNSAEIICFSHPVTESQLPHLGHHLVDMESYGFAFAANKLMSSHGFQLLKIVSDHLDFAHINRKFIEDLMEASFESIVLYAEKFRLFLEKCEQVAPEISREWTLFLEEISLTVSQKSQIRQHLFYLSSIESIPPVPSEIPTFKHASERKLFFEKLLSSLAQ